MSLRYESVHTDGPRLVPTGDHAAKSTRVVVDLVATHQTVGAAEVAEPSRSHGTVSGVGVREQHLRVGAFTSDQSRHVLSPLENEEFVRP